MDIYQKAIEAIRSHPYSFLYHPDFRTTQSRIDGKNVCRKCSASEALDAAGIEDQDEILDMIK